jgi:Domain of Unknown Function with PDB structure (DUF3858)
LGRLLHRKWPWHCLRTVALALGVMFLPTPGGAASKWKDPSDAEKKLIEDPSKGLVGAVYLERIERSESNRTFRVSVRAKILSKAGFDIATVEGVARDAEEISGRTVGATGRVTELSSADIHRITVVRAGGRSIERQVFTLPALEPGCFIEYTFTEKGWLGSASDYHTEILFQEKYRILLQELHTPKVFPFSSSKRQRGGVSIEVRPEGDEYVYSSVNAPALHEEVYGLPKYERAAAVIFSWVFSGVAYKSGDAFWMEATGKLFAPLLKNSFAKPSQVERSLSAIPGSRAADPDARLQAIYAYSQRTVRNRWVLRAGETVPKDGWKKNENAADALAHGEGTPWDIAAVCASLLAADGWKFRVIFTPDREERFFHPEVPSLFQFNGWVIEVKGQGLRGPVYLCFDHPLMTYGQLPWTRLGAAGFAIDLDAGTGEMAEIPQLPPEKNSRHRAWSIALAEDGDVAVKRQSHLNGAQAFSARLDLYTRGRESVEKNLREAYQAFDSPGEIESVAYQNEENPEQDLVETMAFRRKALGGTLAGQRLELSPLAMIGESNPFTQDKREEPIILPYPYRNEDTLTITAPAGYVADALPASIELKTLVGLYAVRVSKGGGNAIIVTRLLSLTRFTASPEYYPEYRRLFEGAARGDAGFSVVFRKAAP